MKTPKYTYEKIIQQNAGQGWEDVSSYPATSQGLALDRETRELLRHDFREYARMGYPVRVVFRRSLSEAARKTYSDAYHTGFEARKQGEPISANPYGTQAWGYDDWLQGWKDAK